MKKVKIFSNHAYAYLKTFIRKKSFIYFFIKNKNVGK